jgi:SAM-dependent methyltransferase
LLPAHRIANLTPAPRHPRRPPTADYYEDHAQAFFDDTIGVDMLPLYERFLARVLVGGHILDAGCGSGRDALAFRRLGYKVTAFDASPALAALAEGLLGCAVPVLRFQDLDWQARFDGIWACASLLHVPMAELPEVLQRLAAALKAGGVLYASFKYGHGERDHNGRRFTDLDEAGLGALLRVVPALVELETWTTADRRTGRGDERWLNTLLEANG